MSEYKYKKKVFKEFDLVLYTGRHLPKGFYQYLKLQYTSSVYPDYDRHRIRSIDKDSHGFMSIFEVDTKDIKPVSNMCKLLFKK